MFVSYKYAYGSGRNLSPLRSTWHYDFIIFYQKQILQAPLLEPVGFLSQNYIALHNNLVNMIVL
jgi:hypothetical protein